MRDKFLVMSDFDIGIDIGGTYIKGVLIQGASVVRQAVRKTNPKEANWQEGVRLIINELAKEVSDPIDNIGLSIPGLCDEHNRMISYMPVRFDGLEGFNWTRFLKREVHVINDGHAALWAESQWGVGKGIKNIAMLTLGTGVGGGLLLDGEIYQGFLQRAGHLGHIVVDGNSQSQDITGMAGSLEEAVGEYSLNERSKGQFKTYFDLLQSYQDGHQIASDIWLETVRKLALGISSLCNAFSPQLVILSGGLIKAGEQLLEPLSNFMDRYEWRPGGSITPIRLAKFQDYPGAIGAALFARSRSSIHNENEKITT